MLQYTSHSYRNSLGRILGVGATGKFKPNMFAKRVRGKSLDRPEIWTLQSLLFWAKNEDPPKKARTFLPAEPLESLKKRAKTHKKRKENRDTRRKKKARKTKVREIWTPCYIGPKMATKVS